MDSKLTLALAISLCTLVLGWVARGVARRVLPRLVARSASRIDDELARGAMTLHGAVLVGIAAWVGFGWVGEHAPGYGVAVLLGRLSILAHVGVWSSGALTALANERAKRAEAGGNQGAVAWRLLVTMGRAGIWGLLGLAALNAAGVDITALIAGLGVGGIAVGLALQNVIGDVFASLSIALDRPFSVGDFIVLDSVSGTVEHIGWKTTRVRALSGEQVVLGNADVLNGRLRNFQRLSERRVLFKFGVLYDTPPDLLASVPERVRTIVMQQAQTRFERAHLAGLGESSIDFEVVYHVLDPDYGRHMDIQHAVLLGLVREMARMGVGFAFPTRTLHLMSHAPVDAGKTVTPSLGRVDARGGVGATHAFDEQPERDAELRHR